MRITHTLCMFDVCANVSICMRVLRFYGCCNCSVLCRFLISLCERHTETSLCCAFFLGLFFRFQLCRFYHILHWYSWRIIVLLRVNRWIREKQRMKGEWFEYCVMSDTKKYVVYTLYLLFLALNFLLCFISIFSSFNDRQRWWW